MAVPQGEWESEMDWGEFDKWWHKHDNTKESDIAFGR
jgi:hypothetical protein